MHSGEAWPAPTPAAPLRRGPSTIPELHWHRSHTPFQLASPLSAKDAQVHCPSWDTQGCTLIFPSDSPSFNPVSLCHPASSRSPTHADDWVLWLLPTVLFHSPLQCEATSTSPSSHPRHEKICRKLLAAGPRMRDLKQLHLVHALQKVTEQPHLAKPPAPS